MADNKNTPSTLKGTRMEDRVSNFSEYPNAVVRNKDGSISTHLMAAEINGDTGRNYAFPMIVQKDDGTMHQFQDTGEAMRWNIANNNAREFDTIEDADQWSQNYKTKEFNSHWGNYNGQGTPAAGDIAEALRGFDGSQPQEILNALGTGARRGIITATNE